MKKNLIIGLFFSSTFLLLVFPQFAETISGNGENSVNSIHIDASTTNSVNQSNTSIYTNDVSAQGNTGGNTASDNTGNAGITTGNMQNNITITNIGNINSASTFCCGLTPAPTSNPGPTDGTPPSSTNSSPSNSSGSSNSSGFDGISLGNTVPTGRVLGISETSGNGIDSAMLAGIGVVCIGFGTMLLKGKKLLG
jgi:hypothetical protein